MQYRFDLRILIDYYKEDMCRVIIYPVHPGEGAQVDLAEFVVWGE